MRRDIRWIWSFYKTVLLIEFMKDLRKDINLNLEKDEIEFLSNLIETTSEEVKRVNKIMLDKVK